MKKSGSQYKTRSGAKHPEALLLAMLITILIIIAFQLYWLKDNYNREQKTLETKAYSLFRETVRNVQDSVLQLKLQLVFKDSATPPGIRRKMFEGSFRQPFPGIPRAARIVDILGQTMTNDSIKKIHKNNKGVFISVNNTEEFRREDSSIKSRIFLDSIRPGQMEEMMVERGDHSQVEKNIDTVKLRRRNWNSIDISENAKDSNQRTFSRINTIFFKNEKGEQISIKIDSLFNDSVSVKELTSVFEKTLAKQKLNIPFTIVRQPENFLAEEDHIRRPMPDDSFAGYKLQLGNSFSLLIKKISLPVLFSFFLVGLTIFSFILLYRSLLRQYRLAEIKNDLISNITHELKTPIATVGVAIEALKNFNAIKDPQKTSEYLDISQNELQRLGLLVDKVLNLSMFENKEVKIKYELVDLGDVVKEVVASLRLQLEKCNASITMNAEGNLVMKGDRLHLLSVVFNLLDNALKYSKENAAIEVDVKEVNENIVLKITDNGIGIPQQYRTKVFEKFFRVPTGDTHNAKGHGLGLSYSAQVIKQHQGSIEVDSHEGLGSSFTVTLPKNIA